MHEAQIHCVWDGLTSDDICLDQDKTQDTSAELIPKEQFALWNYSAAVKFHFPLVSFDQFLATAFRVYFAGFFGSDRHYVNVNPN